MKRTKAKKFLAFAKSIAFRVILLVIFFSILIGVIAYGRGYRFSAKDKLVTSTGIISVSAYPRAAKVYVNGVLKGVTDLNMTLSPGDYEIAVKKDGYSDWTKKVNLKGELVITLDVLLFPKNPSLQSLTNVGITKAIPYNQAEKIILFSDAGDIEKDGIYIFDTTKKPLSFYPPLKLLILKKNLPAGIDFNNVDVDFSPDSQQAIFYFYTADLPYAYLFSLGEETTQPFDISSSYQALQDAWKAEKNKEVLKILETFPKPIRAIALQNFSIISFSPDQTKILYQAKSDLTLQPMITPPVIASNQTLESRSIQKDQFYVYDKKEDKNYLIKLDQNVAKEIKNTPTPPRRRTAYEPTPTPTPVLPFTEKRVPITWHSDSKHLCIEQEHDISMMDYDGTNRRTIYSGPFEKDFFVITNEGKLLVMTNLNPQYNPLADLYEIGIK